MRLCRVCQGIRVSKRHRCSKKQETDRKPRIEKIGKIGNFVSKKQEKTRKINSTFVNKDSLPAPHQGYCCQATRLRSRLIQIAYVTSLGCLCPQHLWSSFRNCLKILRNVSPQFKGIFLPSLAFTLYACKNVVFYTKRDFSWFLSFSLHTLYLCSERSFVFFPNRLTANERALISRAILEIEANAVIYVHTYIITSKNLK